MKVKYLTGKRIGETVHVPRSAEINTLLDLGLIEEVKPTDEEKMEAARNVVGNTLAPCATTPAYGIKEINYPHGFVIVKRVGFETSYLKEADPDTPPHIVAELRRRRGLPSVDEANAEAIAKAKRDQYANDHRTVRLIP